MNKTWVSRCIFHTKLIQVSPFLVIQKLRNITSVLGIIHSSAVKFTILSSFDPKVTMFCDNEAFILRLPDFRSPWTAMMLTEKFWSEQCNVFLTLEYIHESSFSYLQQCNKENWSKQFPVVLLCCTKCMASEPQCFELIF